MRHALAVAVFALWSLPAFAQQPANLSAADTAAIQGVISQQMDAFRRDDGMAAFAFAAPVIQHMFGDPATFLSMVRQQYPAVYRPRSARFLELEMVQGVLTQQVLLVGPDGTEQVAIYTIEKQPDGRWLITGCFLTKPPGESA